MTNTQRERKYAVIRLSRPAKGEVGEVGDRTHRTSAALGKFPRYTEGLLQQTWG